MRFLRLYLRNPAALIGLVLLVGCGSREGAAVRVAVPPGSTLASIGDSLVARGVLANDARFRVQGRIQGVDRRIQVGIYEFTPGISVSEILDRLVAGDGDGKVGEEPLNDPDMIDVEFTCPPRLRRGRLKRRQWLPGP